MRWSAITALPLALTAARLAPPAAPYDELLQHPSANTHSLVLIDVKGAFNSPPARTEDWGAKIPTRGPSRPGFIPSDTKAVATAGPVISSTLVRDFQVGLVRTSRNVPSMRELA